MQVNEPNIGGGEQDLPSQDAIQIANNLSNLGQIYNRDDLSTDVLVRFNSSLDQTGVTRQQGNNIKMPRKLLKHNKLAKMKPVNTLQTGITFAISKKEMFSEEIQEFMIQTMKLTAQIFLLLILPMQGKRPSSGRRWSPCAQLGSSRDRIQYSSPLFQARRGVLVAHLQFNEVLIFS